MTFVFSGFSFILHLAHTLPVCLGPFANIPLLSQCFYSQPIGRRHLQIATCQSGGDWDLACH